LISPSYKHFLIFLYLLYYCNILSRIAESYKIEKKAHRPNLWRDFGVICKRAGLERWADWCQVLRRNCETDWAQKYPQYAVSTWIGHNIQVSARHYLQVPEELYEKVAATNSVETATNREKEELSQESPSRKPF
jgi:hypothetical protein